MLQPFPRISTPRPDLPWWPPLVCYQLYQLVQVDSLDPINTTFKVSDWVNPFFRWILVTLRRILADAVKEIMEVALGSYVTIVGKSFGANALAEYIGSLLVNNNASEIAALGKQGL